MKDRTVCKSCYNMKRMKNKNNTFSQNQQPKLVNVNNENNNPTLIIRFSTCGKTYLMKFILHRNQEPIFINAKSLNGYSKIKAQTSDEFQSLENY